MYNNDYMNHAVEITSVDEYIKIVNEMYQRDDDLGKTFFFRGQAVDFWDIRPSIFRNDLLSVEHNLMAEPKRVTPKEFRDLGDDFEIMEKYQHYGLSTRLLDLTSNPLVALYFACDTYDNMETYITENGEVEERLPNGIVYFKQADSVYRYDDFIIKTIAYIAKLDLDEKIDVSDVLVRLKNAGLLIDDPFDDDKVKSLIARLQDSYVVLPAVNNERLSRQNGAFLFPAKFNFKNAGTNVRETIIEKAACNLRDEFDEMVFYIDSENKESIREELNYYDINEASLFPELEYQLKHIQIGLSKNTKSVARFEKYAELLNESYNKTSIDTKISAEKIIEVVSLYITKKLLADAIVKVFEENDVTDWYKRERIISKIKISICKILLDDKFSKEQAETIASSILNDVIS